jgi:hypothetical protein
VETPVTGGMIATQTCATAIEVRAYFKMRKTGYLKVVACVRMASSSVRTRRSARTDFSSVQGLANGCAAQATAKAARYARQPPPICTDTHHPYKLEGVLQVNRTQGEVEADVLGTDLEMRKTICPKIVACARTDFSSVQVLPVSNSQS